jgi:hypothetical protein
VLIARAGEPGEYGITRSGARPSRAKIQCHCRQDPLVDRIAVALAALHGFDDLSRDRLLNDARSSYSVQRLDHFVEHFAHDLGGVRIEAGIREKRERHGHWPPH